ncbi:hypothetical protein ABZS76_32885 [Streptomyces sp. NPDC005562]|uniref:hypothetical protein n=1 Tax=Streptomyces sp. NPDC005562 TaxID=3154890 RepID=UPI0033AEB3E0
MNITSYGTRVVVRGTLEPEDCEPMVNYAGRCFLPNSFELTFTGADGGGWKTSSVKITGGLFKQDGTPGKAETHHTVWLSDPDTPQWVRNIFTAAHPDTSPPRPPHHLGSVRAAVANGPQQQPLPLKETEALFDTARMVRERPDENLAPGDLQKYVLEAWPQADRFELVGPTSGPGKGVTFSIGRARRWHFAAPDRHLSEEYGSRADAADAFYAYTKEQ